VIWTDNDAPGFKAAGEIGECLRKIGVRSLKTVSYESLKDFPPKWGLADPLPEGKTIHSIRDTLLRAESKAISLALLEGLSQRHGIPLKQLNDLLSSA
jgi:hypothetical protein